MCFKKRRKKCPFLHTVQLFVKIGIIKKILHTGDTESLDRCFYERRRPKSFLAKKKKKKKKSQNP